MLINVFPDSSYDLQPYCHKGIGLHSVPTDEIEEEMINNTSRFWSSLSLMAVYTGRTFRYSDSRRLNPKSVLLEKSLMDWLETHIKDCYVSRTTYCSYHCYITVEACLFCNLSHLIILDPLSSCSAFNCSKELLQVILLIQSVMLWFRHGNVYNKPSMKMKVKAKARSFNPTLNANVETHNDMDKMVVWEAKKPPPAAGLVK